MSAILTDALWAKEFNRDPSIIGQAIAVQGFPVEVIGVAPPKFRGLRLDMPVDMFVPLDAAPFVLGMPPADFREQRWLELVARRKPAVSISSAVLEIERFKDAWQDARGEAADFALRPALFATIEDRDETRKFGALLSVAALLVILIASVNVQGILLARVQDRRRELAIRIALGAQRRRLVTEALLEAAYLAIVGVVGGGAIMTMLIASWMRFELPGRVAVADLDLTPNWHLALFAIVALGVPTIVSSVLPALRASGVSPLAAMGDTRTFGDTRGELRKGSLISLQVALSVVLVVFASLLNRTLYAAHQATAVIGAEDLAVMPLFLPPDDYDQEDASQLIRTLQGRLELRSDVAGTAVGTTVFGRTSLAGMSIEVGGIRRDLPEPFVKNYVSGEFFPLVGLALVAGRGIDSRDHVGAGRVIVVNESLARRFWPDRTPVGERIRVPPSSSSLEIVGVAEDAKGSRRNKVYKSRLGVMV